MSTTQLKIAGAGLFFLLIFLFGYWLSRSGKPYSMALLTVHKLISLGAVVFLGILISQIHQANPLNLTQVSVIAFAALCFAACIVTGGLVSIEKLALPPVVRRLHQFVPYLTLLSTSAILYLLLRQPG
jgi:hypothetical protein